MLTEGVEIQLACELLRRKIRRRRAHRRCLHLWRGFSTLHRPINQSLTNFKIFENSKPKNTKTFLKISPKTNQSSPKFTLSSLNTHQIQPPSDPIHWRKPTENSNSEKPATQHQHTLLFGSFHQQFSTQPKSKNNLNKSTTVDDEIDGALIFS